MDYSVSELENMDLENITFRRPRKSSSMCDVSYTNNNTLTSNTSLISLPNRSFEESYSMLSDQIKKLSTELDSANQEIENLNLENKNLKLDLDKSKKVINMYKRMGLSGSVIEQAKDQHSVKKKQKTKTTTNLTITHANNNLSINNQSVSGKMEEYYNGYDGKKKNKKSEVTTCLKSNVILNDTTTDKNSTKLIKNSVTAAKKRILILADQQGRHICKYLQRLLGDNYFVSSFCKPGCNMSKILNSEVEYISTLNNNDIVIVIGGTNDRNPYEFQSCLVNWLKNCNNVNVLFSEVPYNNILNENKLNYELKFICSKYNNATYVDMNFSRYVPSPKNFFAYLSRMFLREILHIDYKIKIMHYNQNLAKSSQTVDKKTKEIYTQTDITLLDLIVSNDKNPINVENCKLNNLDNIAKNVTNNVIKNQANNTAQVSTSKILSDNENNLANEGINIVNEVSNTNEFFRVSTYQCTPPKH